MPTTSIFVQTSFSLADMEIKTKETGQTQNKCGRRARKRRQRSRKPRPVICSQDREMVGLRQWMKKKARFKCSLIPAVFHGK